MDLGNYRETLFKREKKIFLSLLLFWLLFLKLKKNKIFFVIIWIFNKPPCGLFQTYISPFFSIFYCPLRPNGFLSVQHLFSVVKRSQPFYSILKHPQASFNFLMFRFSSKAFYCMFKYFIKNDFDRSMTVWDRSMTFETVPLCLDATKRLRTAENGHRTLGRLKMLNGRWILKNASKEYDRDGDGHGTKSLLTVN